MSLVQQKQEAVFLKNICADSYNTWNNMNSRAYAIQYPSGADEIDIREMRKWVNNQIEIPYMESHTEDSKHDLDMRKEWEDKRLISKIYSSGFKNNKLRIKWSDGLT